MKSNKKMISVTIGIIAYNEQVTISPLVASLLRQNSDKFRLINIIIISDGSTDNTANVIKGLRNAKIKLMTHKDKKGKSLRINEIFRKADTDITVILDADIQMENDLVISNLVMPFTSDAHLQLVSGTIVPQTPTTFTQKVILAGHQIMHEAKKMVKNRNVYECTGAIRAFRKKLYKELKFPAVTAEDIFPYLYCVSKSYRYRTVKDARVFYTLAATYRDYKTQMNRYLASPREHSELFAENMVQNQFTINTTIKLRALVITLVKNPFWTFMYLCYLAVPKIETLINPKVQGGMWDVSR